MIGLLCKTTHKTQAVAFLQPNHGATAAITHHPDIKLGEVIPEKIEKTAEEKEIQKRKEQLKNLTQSVNTSKELKLSHKL